MQRFFEKNFCEWLKFEITFKMNSVIKDFFSVINVKTLIVIAAACATTFICTELDFYYNVPTDLIGIAIVFPIVFSINAAYSRREKALEHYSVFKGSALSIRYAHMHWIDENSKENRRGLKINGDEHVNRIDTIYKDLFNNLYEYLHAAKPNPKTYDRIIELLGELVAAGDGVPRFHPFTNGLSPAGVFDVLDVCTGQKLLQFWKDGSLLVQSLHITLPRQNEEMALFCLGHA